MDYYSILHLPRDADSLQILNSFKKHVMYAEEKEILGEALEVLSSNWKPIYDAYGYGVLHSGLPPMGDFEGFEAYQYHGDINRTIKEAFSMSLEFAKDTQMIESICPLKTKISKLPTKKIELQVTLEEVLIGVEKLIPFERKVFKDNLISTESCSLNVLIPKAALSGYTVTYKEKGDILPLTISNDIEVMIIVLEHPVYQRLNLDLCCSCVVDLKTRLCGGSVKISTLSGNAETIYVTGDTCVIKGAGLEYEGIFGNLIVNFIVHYPQLTWKQKQAIAGIFEN
eukprot:NODE_7_length_67686_cov_1.621421.p24 type:complete len:283 gc:universal NODE_7_length_67686_cov_1.621421:26993-26145(-)